MNRFAARWFLMIFPSFLATSSWAQAPSAHVEETRARTNSARSAVLPVAKDRLFGAIPIATKSDEARALVEQALDRYEHSQLDEAVAYAHQATEKDPHFALAYAVWSFMARLDQPSAEALHKAEALAPKSTPEEQLLVRWLTGVQQNDVLPAITAMNDLLARYPTNKHVLYLSSEWIYFQQDYERARKILQQILAIDPDFAPALNLLGYSYIQTGEPDPAKAISFLIRYAALRPQRPNPQNSLGEVSRMIGDDQASLQHFAAALKIIPNFISSQVGLGDTCALMGDLVRARQEYDKALPMATNPRDALHAEFQRALVYFWEGKNAAGLAALDALSGKAHQKKEPYSQYEIAFGRALLTPDASQQAQRLGELESWLQKSQPGMIESDRNIALAATLREEVGNYTQGRQTTEAEDKIQKLEQLAAATRDPVVENHYESAKGYLQFAQGDYTNAAESLAADPHSSLVLEKFALAQEKLGNTSAAESARRRMKFLRAATAEWYLASH